MAVAGTGDGAARKSGRSKTAVVPAVSAGAPDTDGGAGRSPRSERTRAALLKAARRVFSRDGFLDARIGDISREAKVAHGSFYTHFTSKEEIFREVLMQVHHESFEVEAQRRHESQLDRDADPISRIAATNAGYLDAYRRNARILATLEQLASSNAAFAAIRRETRDNYIRRSARAIKTWQAEGLVDAALDADCVAKILGGMVERYAHMAYVFDEGCDETTARDTLTRVWASTLGLSTPTTASSRPKGRPRST
jgi:AcrR family transcriptional regulator